VDGTKSEQAQLQGLEQVYIFNPVQLDFKRGSVKQSYTSDNSLAG